MRAYEVLFIIQPDLEEEATAAVVDKFTTLINDNGGEVTNVNKWGKRRLAYEVEGFREGYYTLVNFNGEPATAQELERVFRITDETMKYLITRKDA